MNAQNAFFFEKAAQIDVFYRIFLSCPFPTFFFFDTSISIRHQYRVGSMDDFFSLPPRRRARPEDESVPASSIPPVFFPVPSINTEKELALFQSEAATLRALASDTSMAQKYSLQKARYNTEAFHLALQHVVGSDKKIREALFSSIMHTATLSTQLSKATMTATRYKAELKQAKIQLRRFGAQKLTTRAAALADIENNLSRLTPAELALASTSAEQNAALIRVGHSDEHVNAAAHAVKQSIESQVHNHSELLKILVAEQQRRIAAESRCKAAEELALNHRGETAALLEILQAQQQDVARIRSVEKELHRLKGTVRLIEKQLTPEQIAKAIIPPNMRLPLSYRVFTPPDKSAQVLTELIDQRGTPSDLWALRVMDAQEISFAEVVADWLEKTEELTNINHAMKDQLITQRKLKKTLEATRLMLADEQARRTEAEDVLGRALRQRVLKGHPVSNMVPELDGALRLISELKDCRAALQLELSALKCELQESRAEASEQQTAVESSPIVSQIQLVARLKKQYEDATAKMQHKLAESYAIAQSSLLSCEDFKKKDAKLRNQNKALQSSLEALSQDISTLRRRAANVSEELSQTQKELSDVRVENASLLKRLDRAEQVQFEQQLHAQENSKSSYHSCATGSSAAIQPIESLVELIQQIGDAAQRYCSSAPIGGSHGAVDSCRGTALLLPEEQMTLFAQMQLHLIEATRQSLVTCERIRGECLDVVLKARREQELAQSMYEASQKDRDTLAARVTELEGLLARQSTSIAEKTLLLPANTLEEDKDNARCSALSAALQAATTENEMLQTAVEAYRTQHAAAVATAKRSEQATKIAQEASSRWSQQVKALRDTVTQLRREAALKCETTVANVAAINQTILSEESSALDKGFNLGAGISQEALLELCGRLEKVCEVFTTQKNSDINEQGAEALHSVADESDDDSTENFALDVASIVEDDLAANWKANESLLELALQRQRETKHYAEALKIDVQRAANEASDEEALSENAAQITPIGYPALLKRNIELEEALAMTLKRMDEVEAARLDGQTEVSAQMEAAAQATQLLENERLRFKEAQEQWTKTNEILKSQVDLYTNRINKLESTLK